MGPYGPLIRIGLRYLSGYLVAKGILGAGYDLSADAEVVSIAEVAVGAVIAAGTEGYYALAKRYGWAK